MHTTFGYIRISTDKQEVDRQRLVIHELAREKSLQIDEWIEFTMSGRKVPTEKRMQLIIERLKVADTVLLAELSRLGRGGSGEVFTILHKLTKEEGIRVIAAKPQIDISPGSETDIQTEALIFAFGLASRIEGEMTSQRTKEALAAKKAKGVRLGKPKGVIQASKFDEHREKIEHLLRLGVSVRKIAKLHLGLKNPASLNYYVRTRGLRPD